MPIDPHNLIYLSLVNFQNTTAYRIAGNFSEIETLTIFASRHENAQVSGSNNNIVWATSSANWSDRESMNREN